MLEPSVCASVFVSGPGSTVCLPLLHDVDVPADEAPPAAALQPPQVGFIDIGLPGMDGFEPVRRLRAQPAMRRVVHMRTRNQTPRSHRAAAFSCALQAPHVTHSARKTGFFRA